MPNNMFNIEDSQIRKLEDDLAKLSDRALPYATGRTVQETARIARRFAVQDLDKNFTTRNTFTKRSIQFNKMTSNSRNISQQKASTGSTADYMSDQEFGTTKRAKGKHGVPIPTGSASNEGDRPKPKRRLPTRMNRRKNIRFGTTSKGNLPKRQRNVALIKAAAENKDKFVYMQTSKRKGIFKVQGGKRKPRIKMIWDLTNKTVRIPARPWLLPASEDAVELQPSLYRKHLADQIRRAQLFKNK